MEVICTNDTYDAQKLEFWERHGVSHPIEGKMYNIREVVKHFDGNTGFRLEEIQNPKIPVVHHILQTILYEPTFCSNRFARLSGEPLTKEEIEELIVEQKELSRL